MVPVLFSLALLSTSFVFSFNKLEFDKVLDKHVQRFIKKNNTAGLSVGVIKASFDLEKPFDHIYKFGDAQKFPQITIKESTVFRLGKTTHLFVGLLLAKALNENKLSLKDKASKYLPKSMELPKYHGEEITIEQLAFHLSSLPDEPTTILKRYQVSPQEIGAYLRTYKLPKKPGTVFIHSDLGYSILSVILEKIFKDRIARLYDNEIFKPLQMEMTSLKELKEHYNKLAKSYHGIKLVSSEKVDKGYSFFAPVSSVLSTPSDMQKLLRFCLRIDEKDLSKCLGRYYGENREIPNQSIDRSALGLKLSKLSLSSSLLTYKSSCLYHGFSIAIAFIPDTKTGLVILSNSEDRLENLADQILSDLNAF